MNALRTLCKTNNSPAQLIARLALGIVMFPHGAQQTLGWFGGYGFTGTMNFYHGVMHIPSLFAFISIAAAFAGSLGLIVGLFSRIAAFGIGINMAVAIFTVHLPDGFFMNWSGKQAGEGFEYHLLAIGLALIVMACGAGKWSLDGLITNCKCASKRS
jgi:putative oxidoreductase